MYNKNQVDLYTVVHSYAVHKYSMREQNNT